jgi:ribosomal-protein-alanine N-acetyltransferase
MLPAEAGLVARLFSEAAEAAHWSAQELVQLETSGIRVWVAIEENCMAGAVAAREAADEAEILNLAVAPAWRGRGIGRRLMETALEAVVSSGVRRVFLEVRESNARARAFYSGMGFAESGRRPGYYRHPVEDALVLSRTLG